VTNKIEQIMALALSLKDACCDTETTMQKLKAELEAALKPGGEPAAMFDELRGRPVLVKGAPLLAHGQVLYTAAPPRREPLTNQRVKEMWRKHAPNIGGIFDFAAELQQYHGIGGKE